MNASVFPEQTVAVRTGPLASIDMAPSSESLARAIWPLIVTRAHQLRVPHGLFWPAVFGKVGRVHERQQPPPLRPARQLPARRESGPPGGPGAPHEQPACAQPLAFQVGYSCLCEPGFVQTRPMGGGPVCVDQDECHSETHNCYPGVQCVNTEGGHICGACPPGAAQNRRASHHASRCPPHAGFTGNGRHCADVDECLTRNGGCSTAPPVQCINTPGSSLCAACPAGYVGDGRMCRRSGACSAEPCAPSATCLEAPSAFRPPTPLSIREALACTQAATSASAASARPAPWAAASAPRAATRALSGAPVSATVATEGRAVCVTR